MVTFRQIAKDEWKRGDFRAFAMINKTTGELFEKSKIDFEEHFIEGIGKAKSALFMTSNNIQFSITEYLEPTIPITEIFVLNSPKLKHDFRAVLEALNLNYSDLDWADKSIAD
jgi:hypothetical protein